MKNPDTSSPFADEFSKQAALYSQMRPEYPNELYEFLKDRCKSFELAWDCGCGNGQAAFDLAKYFKKVIATDPSMEQIKNARVHEHIEYRIETSENCSLKDQSADLVTCANSVHWFNHDAFYKEVKRVGKPEGIIAVWSYEIPKVNHEIDLITRKLHDEILGEFWVHANHLVSDKYNDLPFPFERVASPEFHSAKEFTLHQFLDYLRTWSACQKYIRKFQTDPIEILAGQYQELWGNPATSKTIIWELTLLTGHIHV